MALEAELIGAIGNVFNSISRTLVSLIIAILIFFFGFIFGKLAGRISYKALKEAEVNNFLKTSTGLKINAEHIISNIISFFIYFLTIVAALDQIGLANTLLYILSAGIVIFFLLSLFLALRDLMPNLVSGIYLFSKEEVKEGSVLEIGDIKGEIINVDLFHVRLRTKKGDIIYLPNSYAAKSSMKVTRPSSKIRVKKQH